MLSEYFKRQAVDKKEIRQDVEAVEHIRPERLLALGRFLADGDHIIQNDRALGYEFEVFLRANPLAAEEFFRARRLSRFLVQACKKYGDEPNAVIEDINSVAPLGEVRSFLTVLGGAALRAVKVDPLDDLARRGVPMLEGLSYTCDVRVNLPEYQVFEEDPVTREVAPLGWLPVVLMRFVTDENTELICQMNRRKLQLAIRVLQAAENDVLVVEKSLREAGLTPPSDP